MTTGTMLLQRFILGLLRLPRDSRGGIAVSFALAVPALMAALGVATDFAVMVKVKTNLQAAADAAAIAGAREIPLAGTNTKQVTSAAQSFAAYALTGDSVATEKTLAHSNFSVNAAVVGKFSAVKVDITERWSPFFAHVLMADVTPITVTSTARYEGSNNICVLGLAKDNKRAVYLDKGARLTGNDCGVFSNSTDSKGLEVKEGATLTASIVCSAGGTEINKSARVQPSAITDCPKVTDPLASRAPPSVGPCDHTEFKIDKNATVTINPGVYCGGMKIDATSNVTFRPGIYVIKNGELRITGHATVEGEGVGFYLTGTDPKEIKFDRDTHISLTAPTTGPMAGLLFFEDRKLPKRLKHTISSDDARKLVGTIYLPVGDLVIDAKKAVADQSAYTAIIAQAIELNYGPHLVLNADYGTTDVPAPAGITGTSQVVLVD
ncbi:MAG: pilus assembly protein [Rhizobiales bacterium]|nr:pilus assembly protein [Hyphomicrobiales bacterium]